MADEEQGKKRRRGRRRDRKDANDRPEDSAGKDDLTRGDVSGEDIGADMVSESDVADVVDDGPEAAAEEPKDSGKVSRRERTRATTGGGGEVSPMDFWRSGRVRTARERRAGTGPSEPQGFFKRITSLYLPPWVPVGFKFGPLPAPPVRLLS